MVNKKRVSLLDCKLVKSDLFEHLLTETGTSAWLTFKVVYLNFVGNVKAKNYTELVKDLLNAYQTMGCIKSLKSHFHVPT